MLLQRFTILRRRNDTRIEHFDDDSQTENENENEKNKRHQSKLRKELKLFYYHDDGNGGQYHTMKNITTKTTVLIDNNG